MSSGEHYKQIKAAVQLLRAGGVIAFPTETVYGLGADAENPQAVARIFAAKGRPANHPLIVHIGSAVQINHWAEDISPAVRQLVNRFWPGPLTLILKRSQRVPDIVTGSQDTVGLRMPNHPLALAQLTAFGTGIAAPSANRFGRVSPTTAAHVLKELGEKVDIILDGGPCQVGIESTILDLSSEYPRLLRPGAIAIAEIESVLGIAVSAAGQDAPRTSGIFRSHYAPRTPVWLVESATLGNEAKRRLTLGQRIAVLTLFRTILPEGCLRQNLAAEPADYARELYARLHSLDSFGGDAILIETPPRETAWQAVWDRLERAAWAEQEHGEGNDG